jgi:mRNA-degrading endonuclease YafQ of YafQ-DinJ toxin-antitoxin module
MIFRRKPSFKQDFDKLSPPQKKLVEDSFEDVARGLSGDTALYNRFRIKKMKRSDYIYEGHLQINFVFTLHFEYDDVEKICWFRRIGTHDIYNKP